MIVVAVLGLYITFAPLAPQALWWLRHDAPVHVVPRPDVSTGAAAQHAAEDIPAGNWLVVPALDMKEPIYGGGIASLSKGVWHIPDTAVPAERSNTVLVGHRFTYTNPMGVFYYLDKIRVGDPITVYWQGAAYHYRVGKTFVVSADTLDVEAPTAKPVLTLYTCTPLWSAKDRLVVQADLLEGGR